MTRWITNILIWLALTAEVEGFIFEHKWSTPLTTIGTFIFRTIAHVEPWDAMVLLTLAFSYQGAKHKVVPAIAASMKLTMAALLATWLVGVLRGGESYQVYFQLHPLLMGMAVAVLVIANNRTLAHIETLGKVVLAACVYRSFVCILFYVLVAQHLEEMPAALVDHCDSVLFVGGLFVLLANAVVRRTGTSVLWLVLCAIPIITAIVLNNRRLAWLGVAVGLGFVYLLLPKGRVKTRINYGALAVSPIVLAYIAAGWGNPVGIFKPVGAISTMFGDNQDASSVMRDIENYNLLRTLKENWILGFGWGRQYIEEVVAFDISTIFPQYRYLPHNSLLGAIAFTGALGFYGIWQVFAISALMHIKVFRESVSPLARTAALACLAGMAVIELQMWGDLGFNHRMVNTMLAIAVGVAGRLPVLSGLWPSKPVTRVTDPKPVAAGPGPLAR